MQTLRPIVSFLCTVFLLFAALPAQADETYLPNWVGAQTVQTYVEPLEHAGLAEYEPITGTLRLFDNRDQNLFVRFWGSTDEPLTEPKAVRGLSFTVDNISWQVFYLNSLQATKYDVAQIKFFYTDANNKMHVLGPYDFSYGSRFGDSAQIKKDIAKAVQQMAADGETLALEYHCGNQKETVNHSSTIGSYGSNFKSTFYPGFLVVANGKPFNVHFKVFSDSSGGLGGAHESHRTQSLVKIETPTFTFSDFNTYDNSVDFGLDFVVKNDQELRTLAR